jgi:hypothetical protein
MAEAACKPGCTCDTQSNAVQEIAARDRAVHAQFAVTGLVLHDTPPTM